MSPAACALLLLLVGCPTTTLAGRPHAHRHGSQVVSRWGPSSAAEVSATAVAVEEKEEGHTSGAQGHAARTSERDHRDHHSYHESEAALKKRAPAEVPSDSGSKHKHSPERSSKVDDHADSHSRPAEGAQAQPASRPDVKHSSLVQQQAGVLKKCVDKKLGEFAEAREDLKQAHDTLLGLHDSSFAGVFKGYPPTDNQAPEHVQAFLQNMVDVTYQLATIGEADEHQVRERAEVDCQKELGSQVG